ncbi:MAG: PAS domain S-box protein [Fimbriimonadaceae bacterium]
MAENIEDIDEIRARPQLSDREQQLIKLASKGQTDTAIAHRLGISEATVGTYWGRIRIKLGPYSRTELVATVLKAEQERALNALRDENANLVLTLQHAASEGKIERGFGDICLDSAPDAMLIVTEGGVVTTANTAAHELFGYEPGTMLGLSVSSLIPERHRESHDAHREVYVARPRRRAMGEHLSTPALKANGVEFEIRASLATVATPTGTLIICAIRPVPEEPATD